MGQHVTHRHSRLRRKLVMFAIGAASLGGTALIAEPAVAAPTTASSTPVIRDDSLAAVAASALSQLQISVSTGTTAAHQAYAPMRDAIATEVATRLGIEPARMISAWQKADLPHQTALMAAFTQLGVPYRRMTSKPGVGFDCSGLTTYAWGVAGTLLARQSGSQISAAAPRTAENALAGDLVQYPGHVMMYLGVDRAIVHSPYTGRTVEVDHVSERRKVRFANPIG